MHEKCIAMFLKTIYKEKLKVFLSHDRVPTVYSY